ncbi:hypothetical protein [Thalassiella azotivora]
MATFLIGSAVFLFGAAAAAALADRWSSDCPTEPARPSGLRPQARHATRRAHRRARSRVYRSGAVPCGATRDCDDRAVAVILTSSGCVAPACRDCVSERAVEVLAVNPVLVGRPAPEGGEQW